MSDTHDNYLSPWMRLPASNVTRLALGSVRMARYEIRWWWERYSEHDLGERFRKMLDDLDDMERVILCLQGTADGAEPTTTARDAENSTSPKTATSTTSQ